MLLLVIVLLVCGVLITSNGIQGRLSIVSIWLFSMASVGMVIIARLRWGEPRRAPATQRDGTGRNPLTDLVGGYKEDRQYDKE
jgi:hypothetical protein